MSATSRVPLWKRSTDLFIAAIGLVLLFPLMVLIALGVKVTLGSPVLFRQRRLGLRGRPFTLYKFRTMQMAEHETSDETRMTRFGAFLRQTSLDELPELWNVLRGDMSLVGPRPLLMQYRDRYSPEQRRRHEVLPGVTGWAQVNGRNAITWETRLAMDVWYVDHRSFWLDLRILGLTLLCVLRRDGINKEGCPTMPEFMGLVEVASEAQEHKVNIAGS